MAFNDPERTSNAMKLGAEERAVLLIGNSTYGILPRLQMFNDSEVLPKKIENQTYMGKDILSSLGKCIRFRSF